MVSTVDGEAAHPKTAFRILVVDDELFSRQMVKRMLVSLGAECVVTAASTDEARTVMAADPTLSLIICDHYMPGGNGIKLLGELRQGALPLPHDTCFLVATASTSFALTSVALALDADSFLSKPFSREDLARRLYVSLVADTRQIQAKEHFQSMDIGGMLAAAERLDPVARGGGKPPSHPLKPLGYVLPNTPLAADLLVKDGSVLLKKGTVLTRHLIARLTELGVEMVPAADEVIDVLASR
ncbi:MAG: CheY-like receiver [Stygiobacter sp.]|nr:MAG: CheY-like receiver [Stygiobacter sp.]